METDRAIALVYRDKCFSFGWRAQTPPQEFSRLLQSAVCSATGLGSLQGVALHSCDGPGSSRPIRLQDIYAGATRRVAIVMADTKSVQCPAPARSAAATQPRGRSSGAFAKKGGSQLQFMHLMQTSADPAGLGAESRQRQISFNEVQQHASAENAWTILDGRVFNISPYLEYHPGGAAELMRGAGTDCTTLFREVHPWVSVDMIDRLQVGVLSPDTVSTVPHSKPNESEPALHPRQWRAYPLIRSERRGLDALLLRLDLGAGRKLGLRPGQHLKVRLRLGQGQQCRDVEREYTPISDPDATGFVQLLVKVYPNGAVGSALQNLRASDDCTGDCLELLGPFGDLDYLLGGRFKIGQRPMLVVPHVIMVAAGSGVTPMMQLLRVMATESREGAPSPHPPGPRATLIFCNRREEDILLREGLEKMAEAEAKWLRLFLVLSQPASSATWQTRGHNGLLGCGESTIRHFHGHISDHILTEALADEAASSPPDEDDRGQALVLCCGPEGFNHAALDILQQLGLDRSLVHVF